MSGWLADGNVAFAETFVDGLENAPQAFIDLLAAPTPARWWSAL